jgi:hypothetical protein
VIGAAIMVGRIATGEIEEKHTPQSSRPTAASAGRKGGLKGGKARATKMSPEQRQDIAKKAAQARWSKK